MAGSTHSTTRGVSSHVAAPRASKPHGRVSTLTGGWVDVKLQAPAGIGALGVRQVRTSGFGLAEVPGYLLPRLAFDVFHMLHQHPAASGAEPVTAAPLANRAGATDA